MNFATADKATADAWPLHRVGRRLVGACPYCAADGTFSLFPEDYPKDLVLVRGLFNCYTCGIRGCVKDAQ